MKIIPSEKIELITTLSTQEVRIILRDNIQLKKGLTNGFINSKGSKLFEGIFEQDRFEMQRMIKRKNSFLPQIKGCIQTNINGTRLIANFTIHRFSIAFVAIWLGFVSLTFIATIVGITSQGTNPLALVVPLVMFAFGFGLMNYGFNIEKSKSISDLKQILNAKIKERS